MRALIFDTETSGLYPGYNVILQLSYQIINTSDWSVEKEVNHFFSWPDSKVRVSDEAIKINGLTREFLAMKTLSNRKEALEEFATDKDSVDIIVAHNLDFDKQFILESCREENVKYAASGWQNAFDTMKGMTKYCQIPKSFGNGFKWPKLTELADCLRVNYSDLSLHDSSSDVELTKRCFQRAIEKGILQSNNDPRLTIDIEIIDADIYTFIWRKDGKRLTEDTIGTILSKSEIKINQQNAIREWSEKTNNEIDTIVNIYRQSPVILNTEAFIEKLKSVELKRYVRRTFDEKEPTNNDIKLILENEAKHLFRSILFWKNKQKRISYIEENLGQRLFDAQSAYHQRLTAFVNEENKNEQEYNQKAEIEYQNQKAYINGLLNGDLKHIKIALDEANEAIEFPLFLGRTYSINNVGEVDVQLVLPQLADMPHIYGCRLASGNYKIKEMTDIQSRTNYVTCIMGLAFYVAAHYFNAAPSIMNIHICASAILPNIDKEVKIYTIDFSRDQFANLNLKQINPIEEFNLSSHQSNISKNGVIKPIE